MLARLALRFLLVLLLVAACDAGLAPPEPEADAFIAVEITYANPLEAWPSTNELFDLRFVAMPFIPRDTADILQLNRLAISDALPTQPPRTSDTIVLGPAQGVQAGFYVYSVVAENFRRNDLFAWRPVGLYETDNGVFEVIPGETTLVRMTADFTNRPVFPPE